MSAFKPGDRVRYVPLHAHGDHHHHDCELGKVSSVGQTGIVFVLFDGKMYSQACDPESLVVIHSS